MTFFKKIAGFIRNEIWEPVDAEIQTVLCLDALRKNEKMWGMGNSYERGGIQELYIYLMNYAKIRKRYPNAICRHIAAPAEFRAENIAFFEKAEKEWLAEYKKGQGFLFRSAVCLVSIVEYSILSTKLLYTVFVTVAARQRTERQCSCYLEWETRMKKRGVL